MVHMAIKVEKHLKRRGGQRPISTLGSSWRPNVVKPAVNKTKVEPKPETTNRGNQGKTEPCFSRNRDIRYFKC